MRKAACKPALTEKFPVRLQTLSGLVRNPGVWSNDVEPLRRVRRFYLLEGLCLTNVVP